MLSHSDLPALHYKFISSQNSSTVILVDFFFLVETSRRENLVDDLQTLVLQLVSPPSDTHQASCLGLLSRNSKWLPCEVTQNLSPPGSKPMTFSDHSSFTYLCTVNIGQGSRGMHLEELPKCQVYSFLTLVDMNSSTLFNHWGQLPLWDGGSFALSFAQESDVTNIVV